MEKPVEIWKNLEKLREFGVNLVKTTEEPRQIWGKPWKIHREKLRHRKVIGQKIELRYVLENIWEQICERMRNLLETIWSNAEN